MLSGSCFDGSGNKSELWRQQLCNVDSKVTFSLVLKFIFDDMSCQ